MKKLKVILVGASLSFLGACSFKSADQAKGAESNKVVSELNIDERGKDPFIAEVPTLETSFIQNFKIEVNYNLVNDNKPQQFTILSKTKDTDSSFRFRVGKLFGVENAQNFAAKEGRFSGHSYGEIKNEDFSWVKYPLLDPLLLNSDVIKFRPILDGGNLENASINLTFDSSVKLAGYRFKEIKDLSLNFYYHDFEKDSYVLLKNVLVKRTFQRGINETFTVTIENVPLPFLRDTYLKHGEFLVSEVDNYFIPELDKDYKTLMTGIRTKTIPVMLSTPTETTIYYVATGKGVSFLEILNRAFAKNFAVENNVLKKIGQYENNLGTHEHLIDLKDKDKLGNWFVLTNNFKEHFLDHLYTPDDHITLSYVTGNTLASQTSNEQNFYRTKISSETYNEAVAQLGSIGPNSKIEIELKGLNRFGHEVVSTPYNASYSLGGGGNSTQLNYSCSWIGNKSSEYNRSFDLTINYNEEWEKLFLVINEERFKLSSLIADKKVIVRNLNFSFLITIDNISSIKQLKESEENHISLAMVSSLEKKHLGLKLVSQGGLQNQPYCTGGPGALNTIGLANGQYGGVVSKGSIDFSVIEREIVNCRMYPNNYCTTSIFSLKPTDDIDYEQNYSLVISSKITNYYN